MYLYRKKVNNVSSWLQRGLTVNKACKNMRLVRLAHTPREIFGIKWGDSVVLGRLMDSNHIYTWLHKFLVSRKSWLRQKEISVTVEFQVTVQPLWEQFLVVRAERYILKKYILKRFCLFWGNCKTEVCISIAQESAFLGH